MTGFPDDSLVVVRYGAGTFVGSFDWTTGINLPFLLGGTWKIQPTIAVQNITAGPFAIRNNATNGDWVLQGKRANFSLAMSPTFFAFFNVGFIPGLSRMRHSINPLISWSFAPAATVPDAYAQAITLPGQVPVLRSAPQNLLTLALNQNFEVKAKPLPTDTLGTLARKFRLLSIQTSPDRLRLQPGRSSRDGPGGPTQVVNNSLLSDLLPGFSLNFGFDLWRGLAGQDTSQFAPYLNTLNAAFGLSGDTIRSLLGAVGIGSRQAPGLGTGIQPTGAPRSVINDPSNHFLQNQGNGLVNGIPTYSSPLSGAHKGFTSSFVFTLTRFRPSSYPNIDFKPPDQMSLQYNIGFSPTQFWAATWTAQYNFSAGRFESQTVALERELHEWRARFNFVRNANGNFAFYFSIQLTDLPDLHYDYQQTSFEQ